MQSKVDFNTVILVLILIALVVGGVLFFSALRGLTRSRELAERALQEGFEGIANPTPTILPDPVIVIQQVRDLSRLETASYTIEKVITAESGQGSFAFLFGDRLILVARGQVIAGVDLGKMQEGDILVTGEGTAIVKLPSPEILVVTLDNQKSYVVDRDTGVIGMNPALETEARQAAEQEILDAALEDGILEKAQDNAEVYVQQLILALGFNEVVFAQDAPVPLPTATP